MLFFSITSIFKKLLSFDLAFVSPFGTLKKYTWHSFIARDQPHWSPTNLFRFPPFANFPGKPDTKTKWQSWGHYVTNYHSDQLSYDECSTETEVSVYQLRYDESTRNGWAMSRSGREPTFCCCVNNPGNLFLWKHLLHLCFLRMRYSNSRQIWAFHHCDNSHE